MYSQINNLLLGNNSGHREFFKIKAAFKLSQQFITLTSGTEPKLSKQFSTIVTHILIVNLRVATKLITSS